MDISGGSKDKMKNLKNSINLALIITTCTVVQAEDKTLKTDAARINYSVGYQMGGDFKRQGVTLDVDALAKGIADAIAEGDALMSSQEMRTTLIELKRNITAAEEKEVELGAINKRRIADEKLANGAAFLAGNAKKEGVTSLTSGLQYKIIKAGTGRKPTLRNEVTVHYRGTLISGREFDSSQRRGKPVVFTLESVIPGWQEALPLMREGATWEIYIPESLAYGRRGPLAYQSLIFKVELLSIAETASDS